jgi:hypothetical protein
MERFPSPPLAPGCLPHVVKKLKQLEMAWLRILHTSLWSFRVNHPELIGSINTSVGKNAHTETAGCADPTVVEQSGKESEISSPAQHPAVYVCSMRSGWCTGTSTERGAVRPRKGRRLNAISSSSRGR